MRRVTTDEFIAIAEKAMAEGKDYTQATHGLMTEDEADRRRDRDGNYVELLIADLITPATDYNDDGEASGIEGETEWAETEARDNGRYDHVGWTPPPNDPETELMRLVDDIMSEAQVFRLHEAISELLSKQEQAVIHAMFWDGKSQADIARGLGISRQAVHSAYARALTKLREAFGVEIAAPVQRMTQEEMTHYVHFRQRLRGSQVAARLQRIKEAQLA